MPLLPLPFPHRTGRHRELQGTTSSCERLGQPDACTSVEQASSTYSAAPFVPAATIPVPVTLGVPPCLPSPRHAPVSAASLDPPRRPPQGRGTQRSPLGARAQQPSGAVAGLPQPSSPAPPQAPLQQPSGLPGWLGHGVGGGMVGGPRRSVLSLGPRAWDVVDSAQQRAGTPRGGYGGRTAAEAGSGTTPTSALLRCVYVLVLVSPKATGDDHASVKRWGVLLEGASVGGRVAGL